MSINSGVAYVAPRSADPWQESGNADAWTSRLVEMMTRDRTIGPAARHALAHMANRLSPVQRERIYRASRDVSNGAYVRATIARANRQEV